MPATLCMRFPRLLFLFRDRLNRSHDIGDADEALGTVEFDGVRITERDYQGEPAIFLEYVDAPPVRRFQQGILAESDIPSGWRVAPPDKTFKFWNHTALGIRVRSPGGKIKVGAIDPLYSDTQPLSLKDWKDCQNFPGAIIMSGSMFAERLHVHTELMTDEARDRLHGLLAEKGWLVSNEPESLSEFVDKLPVALYQDIMSDFFRLFADSKESRFSVAAKRLARVIMTGKEYTVTRDPRHAKQMFDIITKRLNIVNTYQNWLDKTEEDVP